MPTARAITRTIARGARIALLAGAATLATSRDASAAFATPAATATPIVAATPTRRVWPTFTIATTPTPVPLPSPDFGRVVYRASKAGSYESLGQPVIMCRHRDPGPRRIRVEFYDHLNRRVSVFGVDTLPNVPPGKKVTFVSDVSHLRNRLDVVIVRIGHFGDGTARVVSDARIIHCMARMRFNPGVIVPTYWRSMGLYRADTGATPVPVDW